jgi:hypothetical protein
VRLVTQAASCTLSDQSNAHRRRLRLWRSNE